MITNNIICDICGKTWVDQYGCESHARLTISDGRWGYESKFDEEEHNLDICADCYENMPEPWRSKVRRKDRHREGLDCVGLDTKMDYIEWDEQAYRDREKKIAQYAKTIAEQIAERPDHAEGIIAYYIPHIQNI